jgi:hypothetical protein
MTTEKYQTKNGATQHRPLMTEEEYRRARNEEDAGLCLACGAEAHGVEPDARRYECESCGATKVYGIEELLMMGLVKIV